MSRRHVSLVLHTNLHISLRLSAFKRLKGCTVNRISNIYNIVLRDQLIFSTEIFSFLTFSVSSLQMILADKIARMNCLYRVNVKLRIFFWIILNVVSFCYTAVSATTYVLPIGKSRLIGKNKVIIVPKNNTKPLEYFAAKYQLGLSNMLEANPGVDPYLPKSGTTLNIPQQLILPNVAHEGVVINSPEMRLYYYPKGKNVVFVFPIGIGQLGNNTPTNWITKVERKKTSPSWIPTAKIRAEYSSHGESLPAVIPSGPTNPMGPYALYVGGLYAIHGTNTNFGVGLRISHGCVRLRNDDIMFLFKNVPVGTLVRFINEPVKATIEPDGNRYIEVHNPLSTSKYQFNKNEIVPISLTKEVRHIINQKGIDTIIIDYAIRNRTGMPVRLN